MNHPAVVLLYLLVAVNLNIVRGQTNNDVIYTDPNEPICIPVTNNDAMGTVVVSVSNGTYGTTALNYPPFWYSDAMERLVIEADKYQTLNWGDTTNPYYANSTGCNWVNVTDAGASNGTCVVISPDQGTNTGSYFFGPSLVYNVMFRRATVYKAVPRVYAPNVLSDTAHYLYQPEYFGSTGPVFLSYGGDAFGAGTYGQWVWILGADSVNITQSYPVLSKFYLAMREDGVKVDQLAFSSVAYLTGTSPIQNASRLISCASNEILYFPSVGYGGVDTFSYQTTNGVSNSSSLVTVYVGIPIPSPSVTPSPSRTSSPSSTPSRTPSKTPSTSTSVTPTPSSTPSASVTPTKTPTPSITPSMTPSISPSPSLFSSPSITPSVTPFPSTTSSVTPTASPSPTASVTPSATSSVSPTSSPTPSATPSVTATTTASVTPSSTPSPSSSATSSITPSISPSSSTMPLLCDFMPVSMNSSNYHILQPYGETSNFGQTFKPFATGTLVSFSFHRASSDTGVLNGTAYLLQNYVGNPESGFTYRSFPFSLSGPGWQVFNFTPPFRMDLIRYEFLLASIEGDSPASMVLSDLQLSSQYIIRDEEITPSVSAAFQYCMIPDYLPSPSVSPTPSPAASSSSSPVAEASNSKKNSNAGIIAGSAVGAFVILSLGVFAFIKIRKNTNQDTNSDDLELHEQSGKVSPPNESEPHIYNRTAAAVSVTQYSMVQPVDDDWDIPYAELTLKQELGRGAFGVVYRGTWNGIPVAVKQAIVLSNHFQQQEFFAEAEVMKKLEVHPNVTRLLGLCSSPFCIVLEFVENGSLSSWLLANSLDKETQISIALGIAQGMLHLHRSGITHRDLAARNILLTKEMIPKVSDFGMSRQTLEDKTNKTMSDIGPVRWMAPEAMRKKVYSRKTDAWSYGVVLYEILTRRIPYADLDLVHVATNVIMNELSLVPEIQKEAKEKKYPEVMVRILELCLSFDPQNRPDFETIVAELEKDV